MLTINKNAPEDRPYIAGLDNQKIGLYAPSLWAGKQLALKYFRTTKKNMNLVWIKIAHKDA